MGSMLALEIYVTPEDRDAIVSLFSSRPDHDICVGPRTGHPVFKVYGIGKTSWVENITSK